MAAYARQAKDQELILMATEIKVRAERRAGEMLRDSAERGERAGQSDGGKRAAAERWGSSSDDATSYPPTLSDIGITKDQSHRWQSLASMSEEHFETAVATAKDTAGQVTTAFMLREAEKHRRPQGKPMKGPKAEAIKKELRAVNQPGPQDLGQSCLQVKPWLKPSAETLATWQPSGNLPGNLGLGNQRFGPCGGEAGGDHAR